MKFYNQSKYETFVTIEIRARNFLRACRWHIWSANRRSNDNARESEKSV